MLFISSDATYHMTQNPNMMIIPNKFCNNKCGLNKNPGQGNRTCPHNNLKILYPNLAVEWDYEKNEHGPDYYTSGSKYRVYWIHLANCGCIHRWESAIHSRVGSENRKGRNCPYCAKGTTRFCIHKSLLFTHLHIASEWDYERNLAEGLGRPEDYSHGSVIYVNWRCNSKEGQCGCHKWKCSINDRTNPAHPSKCPYCNSGPSKRLCPHNNLMALYPEVAQEWNHERNMDKPTEYSPRSHVSKWWRCHKDKSHEWKDTINNRTKPASSQCIHCTSPKGSSRVGNEWIELLMMEQKINIQYSKSIEGEYYIDGIGKVDGYCKENNTVYEYHGNFWHGQRSQPG